MSISPRRTLALIAAVGAVALVVGCGTETSNSNASSPKPSPPTATTPAALSAADQAFVSEMRTNYGFDSSVSDRDIAEFGHAVCTTRESGGSQNAAVQLAKSAWTNTSSTDGEAMVRSAERHLCLAQLPVQKWHVIARYSGSSTWNSGEFTLRDSPVRVMFSYSGNSSGFGGDNFMADLVSSTDDLMIANDIAVSGGKTTTLYPDMSLGGSSKYHLEVEATDNWSFTIKQKY